MKKAIFLDRDGVLNKEINNLFKKENVEILPKVKETLKKLKEKGYLLIVITNQPVIARGLIGEKGIKELNKYINLKLDDLIDKFYVCPHHPHANLKEYRKQCDCRKPLPGMILHGAKEFDIDLNQSYVIGDRISDIIAGKKAGCKTILLETDYSHKKIIGEGFEEIEPDFIVKFLKDCLKII